MARSRRSAGSSISSSIGGLGTGCLGDLHRRGSIRAEAGTSGPDGAVGGRSGRRERDRTSTPLTRHRLLRPARLPFRHSPARSLAAGLRPPARRSGAGSIPGVARPRIGVDRPARASVCALAPRGRGSAPAGPGSPRRRSGTASSAADFGRGRQERPGDGQQQQRPDAGPVPLAPAWRRPRSRARARRGPWSRRRRASAASSRPRRAASTRATARARP